MAESKILSGIHSAIQRFNASRWRPFRFREVVRIQAFVRMGPKKIDPVLEEYVVGMARQLEATVVMGEMLEGEHPVAITVTNVELAHFVAYVRQLDDLYRKQVKQIDKQNQRITELESEHKII